MKSNPCHPVVNMDMSRSSRSAWIEMMRCLGISMLIKSRSSRSAWIEIRCRGRQGISDARRAPRGARGLKFDFCDAVCRICGRAPRGARGLKSLAAMSHRSLCQSRSSRSAWIEIRSLWGRRAGERRRAPRGARGLKLIIRTPLSVMYLSRSSRSAWIEIPRRTPEARPCESRAPRGARGLKSLL